MKAIGILDNLPVDEIVRRYNGGKGETLTALAAEFGVRRNTLNQALLREGLIDRQEFGVRREEPIDQQGFSDGDAKFMAAWNESASVAGAAERLGMAAVAAKARAKRLRKKGLALKSMPRGTASKATPEEFAATWNVAGSIDEAAARFGFSRQAAIRRAAYLRKQGVELKDMKAGASFAPRRSRPHAMPDEEIEAFILAWNASRTLTEAAERLGMSRQDASRRAAYLRGPRGLALKRFKPGRAQREPAISGARPVLRIDPAWIAAWEDAADQRTAATPTPAPPAGEKVDCLFCWDTGLCPECLGRYPGECPAFCESGTCRCEAGRARLAPANQAAATGKGEKARRLTREMVEAMLYIHHEYGIALEHLAPVAGVTPRGARKAAGRFGLPAFRTHEEAQALRARSVSPQERRLMEHLRAEGYSVERISAIADRPPQTVYHTLQRPAEPRAAHPPVDRETFIRLWQEAEWLEDAMKATGLSAAAVRRRAAYLRKRGVALRALSRRVDGRRRKA